MAANRELQAANKKLEMENKKLKKQLSAHGGTKVSLSITASVFIHLFSHLSFGNRMEIT